LRAGKPEHISNLMNRKIWVTGTGVVSSVGMDYGECLYSLRNRSTGIGKIRILETIHRSDFVAGEIGYTNRELMKLLGILPEREKEYSRTSLLGMIAAREAILDAGLNGDDGARTALVSASTVGGMDRTEIEYPKKNIESGFVHTHPCGDSTDRIADFLGLRDYRTTLSTACSSGANAIIHGARLIRHGRADRVVAGGVDALSKFTINGFNSLMILDREACRPFDRDRKGLNLGEGAGYLVLESDELAVRRKGRRMCRLSGYANTNDAYHQTASSPDGEGAFGAMSAALSMSGLEPSGISYINVHGTGTENNDASEGAALIRLFGNDLPPFSSTKSFTGHCLGAAAGLEAVFSIMAIRENILIPSLNFSHPIDGLGISPETETREGVTVDHVLSNSFGFGGNNSALIFSKG
jgi:3-oxoacyl-(acyl-carrier-protein) synthase